MQASQAAREVQYLTRTSRQVRILFQDGARLETLVIFDVLRLGARDLRRCSCELRLRSLETISRRNRYAHFLFIQAARTEVQKRNALKLLVD